MKPLREIPKPGPGEYAPYTSMYIDLLPDDGLVLRHLKENFRQMKALAMSLPAEKLTYRYAPKKWSVKEILVHIVDDERIYAYRALRFARNDKTNLPGFEQDDYANECNADGRDIENILEEYEGVRISTVALFNGFDDTVFSRKGIASGNPVSVRAAAYHIAGHELHHLNRIKKYYL